MSFPVALTGVALVAVIVLGWGLGGYALYEPDEARHAEVAREMLDSGTWRDWIVPRLDAAPYRNKPAPFYWLMAASFASFGLSEGAARLVSALSALTIVLVVSLWASRRWDPVTSALAGFVLVTAPEFAMLGRFATLDMSVTLWTTIGMLAMYRFAERPGSSLVPAAAAGALGLLCKGVLAPGFIALVGLIWLAMRGGLRRLTPRALGAAALVFLAIVLPWHAAVAVLDPTYLWKLYVDQQWNRAVEASTRLHARPLLFYVPIVLGGFFPWSAFLPGSIRGTLWPPRRGPEETFCALWASVVFIVLSLAEGKIPSYIVVAFPPLALLTARYLGRVVTGELAGSERFLAWAGAWAVVASLVVAPAVVIAMGHLLYEAALGPTSLWSLFLVLPAIGLSLLLRRGRLGEAVLLSGVATLVLLLVFFRLAAPSLMEVHSDAALARTFSAANPPGSTAPLVAYGLQSPSTSFYTRRPLLLRDRRRHLRALLAEHPLVFVVTSPEHVAEIQAAGPFVPWYIGARRVLYASQPPPARDGETPPAP